MIVARGAAEAESFASEISRELAVASRNRPRGPLPEIHFERVGTWSIENASSHVLDWIDAQVATREPAHV